MSKKNKLLNKKIKLFDAFFLKLLKEKKNINLKSKITIKTSKEWDSVNHLIIIFKLEALFKLKIKESIINKLNSHSNIINYVKKNYR